MMGEDRIRDWTRSLAGGSFKGFPFQTDREGVQDAGRFVALHPFVMAEDHATEDLGRKPRRFAVNAYIVGNAADARAQDFIEVCSSPGEGILVLPMHGAVLARCIDCSTSAERTRLGYVGFSLMFVEAGLETGGFPAILIGDRIAEDLLKSLPGVVGDVILGFGSVS